MPSTTTPEPPAGSTSVGDAPDVTLRRAAPARGPPGLLASYAWTGIPVSTSLSSWQWSSRS